MARDFASGSTQYLQYDGARRIAASQKLEMHITPVFFLEKEPPGDAELVKVEIRET